MYTIFFLSTPLPSMNYMYILVLMKFSQKYQNKGNNNNILFKKNFSRHPMTNFELDEKYG